VSLTCGQALVGLLREHGVDTVFGIPGVHTLELYRGLEGSGLRHVLVRHEQGAGFMADGFARASARPAACFVITGPGVTNIATPMGQAYSDSVPMLVISSVNERRYLGRGEGRLHEITDQAAVARPLAGLQGTAHTPAEAEMLVNLAFRRFRSARPRPAHVEIPLDVLEEPAAPFRAQSRPAIPHAGEDALGAALEVLQAAREPAIVVGGGARHAGAAITRIAERLGAPVATTIAAKGAVADAWPLSLSSTLASKRTFGWLQRCDALLLVGTEFAHTDHWQDTFDFRGRIVRIDIDPGKLSAPVPAHVGVVGDAGDALARLSRMLGPGDANARADETVCRVAAVRRAIRDGVTGFEARHLRVLDTLRAALPAPSVVTTDMTQIAYTGCTLFECAVPDCWLHPVGYGTLGYAVPAAIGAGLGCPERPVAALAGDAGLLFTAPELATAAELRLSLPVVLWNNDALGQIRDDMIGRGIAPVGVVGRNPSFEALARAFHCGYVQPRSLDELGEAVGAALGAGRPTVIEVRQDSAYLDG